MRTDQNVFMDGRSTIEVGDTFGAPYLAIRDGAYRSQTILYLGGELGTGELNAASRQLDQLERAIAKARTLIAAHRRAEVDDPDEPDDEPDDEPVLTDVQRSMPVNDEAAAAAIVAGLDR